MLLSKRIYLGVDEFVEDSQGGRKELFEKFFYKDDSIEVIKDLPENFVNKGIKFLYVFTIEHLSKIEGGIPQIEERILGYIREGKCKLILFYPHEGHIYKKKDLIKIIEYCQKYKLNKNNTFLLHSNLALKDQITTLELPDTFFTVEKIMYFESNPWFIYLTNNEKEVDYKKNLYKQFSNRLSKKINNVKPYYFSCLNRLPRPHRVFTYVSLYSTPEVLSKTRISLGPYKLFNEPNFNIDSFRSIFFDHVLEPYYMRFLKEKGEEWKKFGLLTDTELESNQANSLNLFVYDETYISIISETEVDQGTLFFSEKTFKPIAVGHPFLSINGKHSLKKLKELGYKTFDKWWDESYDEIEDWKDRITAIHSVLTSLSKLSSLELKNMVVDMHDTLQHNIHTFFYNDRETKLYERILQIQNS